MIQKIIKRILFSYLLIAGVLFLLQDRIIFRANPSPDNFQFSFEQPFIEKNYTAPDGTSISTLLFPAEGESKGLVFNNHGNRRNISRWGHTASDFTSRGYDVFYYDYRGFGKTKGHPSEKNILRDAEFLYNQIKLKYNEDSIVIYGRSLGTGVATKLAADHKPKMLILETPYYNLADIGYLQLPIFPYKYMLKHSFRTDQWIRNVRCPIHIFHGTEDELVPYESSLKLINDLNLPVDSILTTLPEGRHRGLSRFEAYQKKLDELLK